MYTQSVGNFYQLIQNIQFSQADSGVPVDGVSEPHPKTKQYNCSVSQSEQVYLILDSYKNV